MNATKKKNINLIWDLIASMTDCNAGYFEDTNIKFAL
jgi:hypothetical protein